jgi:uncharacterized protein (DUF362 family)/Pyruvate/2-oxoacid:ferredoxin oxidoreductase delta subunit
MRAEPIVAVQACDTYDRDAVEASVRACLDAIGGLESFVRPGDRVFCKVNLLISPARPDHAITTHPEVVRAIIHEVRRVGAVPLVSDNPALKISKTMLKNSGILPVLEEEKVEAPDLSETVEIANPAGRAFKSFRVSKAIAEADVLLNLPKVKTHALTYMTGAVKNLFGLIPGTAKARWHLQAPAPELFASCICDLYGAVLGHFGGERRMLHLSDGIRAMEGDGPGAGGRPRQLGALLASADAVALDRVACALVGLDSELNLIVREAARRGMGEGDLSRIRWVGAPAEHWRGVRFQPPPGSIHETTLAGRLMSSPWLKNRLINRPLLDHEKCSGCQKCKQICPADAIAFAGKPVEPQFFLRSCIRCYCCAEVCPEGAIRKSAVPVLGRLLRLS